MFTLSRINFRNIVTLFGGWVGVFVLICAVCLSYYLYFNVTETDTDSTYTTVYKKSTIFSTLDRDLNYLSKEDIDKISKHPSVIEAQVYTNSNFRVVASIEIPQQGRLSTELFFESVPDDMLDIEFPKEYPENTVPIVIPKSYLNLYNLGFSRSQGLPIVSPALLKTLVFNVDVYGGSEKYRMSGRIAGLTNRFNTILIPDTLLKKLNSRFGTVQDNKPVKLAVVCKSIEKEQFMAFISELNMETEESSTQPEYIRKTGLLLIPGLIILAMLLISLSGLLIVSQMFLKLSQKSILITRYYELGYQPEQLLGMFLKSSTMEILAIILPALILSELVHLKILSLLDISWSGMASMLSVLTAVLTGLVLFAFQYFKTRKELKKRYL